jgi:hypothetical protein
MDFLLFPQPLIACLLTEWLDGRSVAKLDVAMCDHPPRDTYLRALRSPCTVFSGLKAPESGMKVSTAAWFLAWMSGSS